MRNVTTPPRASRTSKGSSGGARFGSGMLATLDGAASSPEALSHVKVNPRGMSRFLVGFALEPLTEVGMCNAADRLCALGYGSSLQIDHAVLGDHIHHVRARRRDDVAGREVEHDAAAALTSPLVSRGEADER